MSNAAERARYEIETIEIKEETMEDESSVEILGDSVPEVKVLDGRCSESGNAKMECLVLEDDPANGCSVNVKEYPSLYSADVDKLLSCRMSCRGQQALDEHLIEKHWCSFVKVEGVQGPLQINRQQETDLSIVSTTVLPGALWTGERFLAFHHCPECRQSFQCLNSQNTVYLMRAQCGNKEAEGDLPEVAETVFHCVKCGKTFQHKEVLKVHHLTHVEARPYSCIECGKTFAQFDSLKLHSLSHSEETQSSASDNSLLAKNVVKRSSQPCTHMSFEV
ncbi:hypothetical protein JZ751_026239 [Albula glossodonta]|uniref:C2H2-type domain-containing protein n=1 Tax=Albula glossodonta TaxID=121402 RepID=A0A8T2PDU3_9TELE|nr:hypothetical protein JZ751_026239 [Albula glossodonta]